MLIRKANQSSHLTVKKEDLANLEVVVVHHTTNKAFMEESVEETLPTSSS